MATDDPPELPIGQSLSKRTPVAMACGVAGLLLLGGGLMWRADRRTSKVALTDSPKPVAYVEAQKDAYQPKRQYIGTLEPWVMARVGPQFISAYVDTVLVRPGAVVKRGEIIATLDCRNASAQSQSVAMQARALDARQQALAHEAARTQGMLGGGFVSQNAVEQIAAQSMAEAAELESTKAKLTRSSLEVSDCILRAPFGGEVATRSMDPGAFARPGDEIVAVVDRSIIRLVSDAPESDVNVVAPNTKAKVRCFATNKTLEAVVVRRSPSADPGTRTVRFEIDLADPNREIPVGTTGEIQIDVGEAIPASSIPMYAATVRGKNAMVYVINASGVAQSQTYGVLGESSGTLFVQPNLPPGAHVVSEGRNALNDGDSVAGKLEPATKVTSAVAPQIVTGAAVKEAIP